MLLNESKSTRRMCWKGDELMEVHTPHGISHIHIQRDVRMHIGDYLNVQCKVLIISDDGVPYEYVQTIAMQCPQASVHIVAHGEVSKSLEQVKEIVCRLVELDFKKTDMIFAVGGGVIGDLSGYVAASYRLGIPYASLPTTTLSQIDSSIGGKTAVNLHGVKNILGAFYHPQHVFIDLNTLQTLSRRQYYSGLVEALKAGMIRDPKLFSLFENNDANFNGKLPPADLEEIIERSLIVKRDIVEADERENGQRKLLNFGHTLGHAVESCYALKGLTHGESVGIGMMMILKQESLRQRLKKILMKMNLPYDADCDTEQLLAYVERDKKAADSMISIVQVDSIGEGYVKELPICELRNYMEEKV